MNTKVTELHQVLTSLLKVVFLIQVGSRTGKHLEGIQSEPCRVGACSDSNLNL